MKEAGIQGVSRREVVAGSLAMAAAPTMGAAPLLAEIDDMKREMAKLVGKAAIKPGRVTVKIPELTENGNSTSLSVMVSSPMTAADHVRAVHIFSEKNPVSYIARIGIGPRAGKAQVSTSIRVADSQTITVLAEMSDGSFWSGQGTTEVTTPACIDDSDRPR